VTFAVILSLTFWTGSSAKIGTGRALFGEHAWPASSSIQFKPASSITCWLAVARFFWESAYPFTLRVVLGQKVPISRHSGEKLYPELR
jgi:hypothetical protein